MQFFGRPVYEGESGAQYLYWRSSDKEMKDGFQEEQAPGDAVAAKKLFEHPGYWAIAKEVGASKDDCMAWIEDDAVTPHQINQKSKWQVKTETGWVQSMEMKLTLEEWNRSNDLMDDFDQEEEVKSEASPTSPGQDPTKALLGLSAASKAKASSSGGK